VLDHIGINCADYRKSQVFYDTVLGVLGFSRQMDFGEAIGYGRDGKPAFWIAEGAGMGPNREIHLAFQAADDDAVLAFHDAAVGLGYESLHAARLWPEYHPGYFGVSLAPPRWDPDGNNVEAVCHHA
jgi:catechol 2,3-dioxygenase-like lactoylglutathione lyase family enzyme